jgi:hypothetical protein
MVLYWAPRATVPGDPCSGVDEYINAANRTTPDLDSTFAKLNEAFFIFFVCFAVLCLSVWFFYRHEPRLASRRLTLTLSAAAVCLVAFVVICGRRLAIGANGGWAMSCQVHFWLYVSMGSLQSTVGVLRLLQLLNMARFARGARQMRRVIADDKSESSMVTKSQYLLSTREDLWAVGKLFKAVGFSFGFGASATRIAKGEDRHKDHLADVLALELSSESLKPTTLVVMFTLFYIPTLICIICVFTLVDPYTSPSCTGCDVFGEELICIMGLYTIVSLTRIRLAALLKNEPDPDGVVDEMKMNFITLVPLLIIGVTLLIVDPGHLDYQLIITWEWLLALGLFGVFCVSVPYQIHLARKERQLQTMQLNKRRQSRSQDLEPMVALKNKHIFLKFEQFAEESFCSESVAFVADAWAWKAQYPNRPEEWRLLKARAISNMYIVQFSLLQINIPSKMRTAVETQIESEQVLAEALFDDAVEEIVKMLKWNLWGKFVATGGADEETPMRPINMPGSTKSHAGGSTLTSPMSDGGVQSVF